MADTICTTINGAVWRAHYSPKTCLIHDGRAHIPQEGHPPLHYIQTNARGVISLAHPMQAERSW